MSRIERPALWAVLAWGLPLLGGGIAPFVGVMVVDRYLAPFDLDSFDIQLSVWTQWSLGVVVTAAVLLGVYVGVAFWVVGMRMGWTLAGTFMAVLVAATYCLIAVEATVDRIDEQARPIEGGLPGPLIGLRPTLVCVEPLQQPFSFIGSAPPVPGAAAVYFGRADGRLAVWSAASGGVLVDEQTVSLRVVNDDAACRPAPAR